MKIFIVAAIFMFSGCSFIGTVEISGFVKNYLKGTEYVYYKVSKFRRTISPDEIRTNYNHLEIFNPNGEFRFSVTSLNSNPIQEMDSITIFKVDNGKEIRVTSLRYTSDLSGSFIKDSKGTRFRIRKLGKFRWVLDNLIIEDFSE